MDLMTIIKDFVMNWISVGIFVMALVNIACLPFFIREMARRNLIWTLVEEGTAKAIMGAGDSGFQKFVYQYTGWRLNEKWDVVSETKTREKFRDKIRRWLGLTGVRLLGIPGLHSVHRYRFRWNSLKQAPDETTTDAGGIYFTPHDEELDYIILQEDVYYARVESAEDVNMVPLDFDITLRIQVINPYKALFVAQEWLEMTWGIVLPAIRRFVATQKWEVLSKRMAEKEKKFEEEILGTSFQEMRDNFGVDIKELKIIRIRPAGKRAVMYEEAATKQYEAEQEAKRIKTLAAAEKARIKEVYGQIQEFEELGQLIRRLEALEKAAAGAGNTIISAPELSNIAKAVEDISKKLK